MPLSPTRKRLNTVFGLLILGVIGYVMWPFVFGAGQMKDFCSELAMGQSLEQVQAKVAERGYRLATPDNSDPFVYDTASMARFNCNLHFGSGGLDLAEYVLND